MRINFNRTYRYDAPSPNDPRRRMLHEFVLLLADDYDIDMSRVHTWIRTKKGLEEFVKYLSEAGYTVKSYTWPPSEKDPLSWGLEFDENNPNFIAFKLRHSDGKDKK